MLKSTAVTLTQVTECMQIRPRYSDTEHPRVSWGRGGSRKCRERKLTLCSLSVQRVPLQNLLYAGRHYYELHVTDEQTEEGGFSSVTLVQDRIGNQGCFPDSKSKLLLYYITCSQTFPATRS